MLDVGSVAGQLDELAHAAAAPTMASHVQLHVIIPHLRVGPGLWKHRGSRILQPELLRDVVYQRGLPVDE
eukprot:3774581-Pyramimonas_sp.AAC.1